MTKDEAMKLALDDLIAEYDMENSSFAKRVDDIFKEALAEQPALFNGWQPAETAPKGARILFLPKKGERATVQDPINICWWSEEHNGWCSDLCNDFGGTEDFDFWMPLPPIQQPAPVQPVSGFGLAAIGQKHFGNPIPKAWYAAARELMAGQPAQQEPDAIGCKCSECGAWQRWTPSGMVCKNGHGGVPGINHRLYTSPPAQQEPWGFHIQFNNGKDATFKGLDYLAECEAHLEAGETITMLYIKENT